MPPAATWYRGLDTLRVFLHVGPLSGKFRWRHQATVANGQPAIGAYTWHEDEQAYLPFALDVLTLEGDRIKDVTAFIARPSLDEEREFYERWPDRELDPGKVFSFFERFGLPARLTEG